MNYVTKEIKYSKTLRKVLKKTVSFKEKDISSKFKTRNQKSNPTIIGNAYELVFQIEYFKKEKNIFEFYNLKYSRTKKLLMENVHTEKTENILKSIFEHEKNIIRYMSGKKVKDLYKSILYLTEVSFIREIHDSIKFIEKSNKKDIKELKSLHKKINKRIFKKIKGADFNVVLQSGYLVGEIDILNKSMITDIKTTIFPTITKDMIYQQILYKIVLESSNPDRKIKYISIYLSKYNKLVTFKYSKIIKNEKLLKKHLQKAYRLKSF